MTHRIRAHGPQVEEHREVFRQMEVDARKSMARLVAELDRLVRQRHPEAFLALDARDGQVLYRFNTGGPINGGIVAYSVGEKEHVPVMSGATSRFFADLPGSATVVVFAQP